MTRHWFRLGCSLLALGAWLVALPARGAAQQAAGPTVERPLATREALQALVHQLEQGAPQDANRLARVRARLEEGDFRPGDLILIDVQGEAALSDTFQVGPDRELQLPAPTVGSLPLKGVLRSELQAQVASYIGRFVENPVVRARPLLRLSIQGEVAHAGIYGVPANAVLADALMAAGGTTPMANMRKLRIEREGQPILEGNALQQALAAGRTLDETNLRDGDQIIVARRPDQNLFGGLRFVWLVVSITGGVYGLSRAF